MNTITSKTIQVIIHDFCVMKSYVNNGTTENPFYLPLLYITVLEKGFEDKPKRYYTCNLIPDHKLIFYPEAEPGGRMQKHFTQWVSKLLKRGITVVYDCNPGSSFIADTKKKILDPEDVLPVFQRGIHCISSFHEVWESQKTDFLLYYKKDGVYGSLSLIPEYLSPVAIVNYLEENGYFLQDIQNAKTSILHSISKYDMEYNRMKVDKYYVLSVKREEEGFQEKYFAAFRYVAYKEDPMIPAFVDSIHAACLFPSEEIVLNLITKIKNSFHDYSIEVLEINEPKTLRLRDWFKLYSQ